MSNIIDTLITDRGPETYYNASDLNRMGEAVQYLANLLTEYGYTIEVSARADWGEVEFPTRAAMERYLDNVRRLRDAYFTLPTTPPLPDTMRHLGYEGANAIEQVLADIARILAWLRDTSRYSNVLFGGEEWDGARVRFLHRYTMTELEAFTMAELSHRTMNELTNGW